MDPTGCLRLLCPRPHQVRELMPLIHSPSGYTDNYISLEWLKRCFHPQTLGQAGNNCRLLIADGFGTHELAKIQRFAYEHNIILARPGSHTLYKCQPCDVGPFGPLKIAYREEVEWLYRGGANHIGKPYFTLLYDRVRQKAFTTRNIRSGWKKTGLNPWNPSIVLDTIQRPQADIHVQSPRVERIITHHQFHTIQHVIETSKTSDNLVSLRKDLEACISKRGILDTPSKVWISKIANAAENAFADRALLLDDNQLLFEQNCEKTRRNITRLTIIGIARVLSYEDLVEAELLRDTQEAKEEAKRGRRQAKGNNTTPA